MPVLQRKRRADADAEPAPIARRRRSEADEEASTSASEASAPVEEEEESLSAGGHQQMVKKLVRLALASEYSRQPLRRADIGVKVLGSTASRNSFKAVFADANAALRNTFGMELSELPLKDKVTVAQKRAAHMQANAQTSASSTTSKAYILTSTLPLAYRNPIILPPPKAPTVQNEAAYEGFVCFVVGLIYISEGQRLSEGKLLRHLRACNADELVLDGERIENVLKKLERQGYIVKIKERDGAGGEESIEYVVGPRGKLEIGPQGVAGLVHSVYSKRDNQLEELEDRLEVSLGVGSFRRKTSKQNEGSDGQNEGEEEGSTSAASGGQDQTRNRREREKATYGRRRTRSTRNAAEEDEEDEDDNDE